jgi:uncharacterized repeat protein (TIGR01451 family)
MSHHHPTRKHIYRTAIVSALLLGGSCLMNLSSLAASPAPGTSIDNQATGSFVDDGASTPTTITVQSDIVTLTVGEVAGITVTVNGVTGTPNPGVTVYYSFVITNVGNDPTQFFIPSLGNLTGNATQPSNIEITGYNLTGTTPVSIATPIVVPTGGGQTGSNGTVAGLLGTNGGGIIQPGGSVTVRVPVKVNANALATDAIVVRLGDTPVDPASTATPQARLENQVYLAGSNDVYTVDNPDSLETSTGMPINGDPTFHRQEASAVVQSIAAAATRDYGDAPATYDSGTAASHLVPASPTVYLGTLPPDKELAPNTPLDGSGDNSIGTNDEDGVTFVGGTTLNTGATASVSVVTRGTGVLYAWIDFNGNGTFESSERITNWAGGNSSTGGTTTLTFGVPEGFTGTTYARFRYSSDVAAANPTGSANDGEVEDYQITLAPRLTPATYGNGTPVRKGVCSIYSSTGADQVVTAPAGAKGLTVKLWGAGGGHEIVGTGYAGAGGYTDAQFGSSVVTPGAQFTLVVGRGGVSGGRPDEFNPTAVYGFGAVAGHEQGGGLAGLFTGGATVLETDRARTLAIAGGGGGYEHSGGSGTGTTGGNGNGPSSGGQSTMRGSTDNLTRTSNSSVIMTAHISSGGGGYQGGGRLPAPNPYSAVTGGSLANIAAASGGSGFVAGTATFGRILSTTDGIGTPPNTTDSDYLTGIGTAGTLSANAGGNARAVLCWDVNDYGDAPATYDVGTPASHLLSSSPSVYLGAIAPDGESGQQPSVAADGDNTNGTSDEDAFTTLSNVPTAGSYSLNSIPVKNTSGAAATLNAWIDFNKDGVFQASEYTSVSIPANATTANLNWASIPAGTTAGSTYARFRITTDTLSDNASTATVDERSTGSAIDGEVEDYAVSIASKAKANVLLVKRITAINGDRTKNPNDNTPLNTFVDNTTTTADNDPNWPSNYLLGESTAGKVKPGDEIEYTIYYLNQGDNPATLVKICDLLAPNLVFNPSGFDSNIGFRLQLGTSPAQTLTSANDPTIDRAQYINAPFVSLSGCNSPTNTTNASGAVVLDLNSTSATDPSIPTNLLTIPGATSSSPIPNDSYGSIRFKAKVK